MEKVSIKDEQLTGLISSAYRRTKQQIVSTRLLYDADEQFWLKCENEQKTGSFKWRGALAKLSLQEKGQSIVTASTGNHALGIANASALYGLQATIFLPRTTSPKKIDLLNSLGVDLRSVEGDSLVAELEGKSYAESKGLTWVSPYNDIDVISGQGTIGLEILEALKDVDKIYITVGGGGLISGIATWIKTHSPQTEIIGCQPVNSPEMYLSVLADHVVTAPDSLPTLSDGSAGPLEEDSITFDICRTHTDRFIMVHEKEIEAALKQVFDSHQMIIEGAAGVAFAAAKHDKLRTAQDKVVVVLCGGNIDSSIHQRICTV